MNFGGVKFGRTFVATAKINDNDSGRRECKLCSGAVHRSWLTGILHKNCRACRQLIMTYGPNIEVTRIEA